MREFIVMVLLVAGATEVRSQKGGSKGASRGKNEPGDKKTTTNSNKPQLLRSEPTVFATGSTGGGACVPSGTIYYVTPEHKLIRSDPEGSYRKNEVPIADNVALAYNGYDDALWYVDTEGKVWRTHYQGKPEQVPNQPDGVKFARLNVRSYDESYAVTQDKKWYHYYSHKWIVDETAKNAVDSGIGNDGTVMYVDSDAKIFVWDFEQLKWVPYEKNGKGFDMYDIDTVVVFDDKGSAQKRLNGTWVPVTESKCNDVFLNNDSFICITPEKQAKLIPY